MPISIRCPGCQKKLRAKDQMAGREVKCPSCGAPFVIPVRRDVPTARPHSDSPLVRAVGRGNAVEVAKLLRRQDFTIIEATEESDGGGKAAVMAQVDGFSVLVAFTSRGHAERFAGAVPGMLGDDGTMPAFVVAGKDLLTYLPDGHGVLLNPETEDAAVVPPDLVDEIKSLG
jgi:phage FluMu protein Com